MIDGFGYFFFNFLFDSVGEFGTWADELTLRDADVVRATGVGGAVVVGGGIREVGMDDNGAIVRSELDRASQVAGGACEDFAVGCSAAVFLG